MTTFSDLMKRGLENKRINKNQLSVLINVHRSLLTRLESGKVLPSRKIAQAITILDINPEELLIAAGWLPEDIENQVFRLCQEKGCDEIRHILKKVEHDDDSSKTNPTNSI